MAAMTVRNVLFVIIAGVLIGTGVYIFMVLRSATARGRAVSRWMATPSDYADLMIPAGTRCGSAPFIFPTDGVAGYIWGDMFSLGHRHQGVDIFTNTAPGVTPVVAVSDGYLSRLSYWKAALIERIPSDPLDPGRQIWVYYTHMADPAGDSFISPDFPAGTSDVFVKAGTRLGYAGDYSGDPNNPVGVHLHISVVKDRDGGFMNELDINNTYDPSPYFGLALNASLNRDQIPVCGQVNTGAQP
jgi:hypothetical protein